MSVVIEDVFAQVLDLSRQENPTIRRAKALLLRGLTLGKLELIWDRFCRFIVQQLKNGKGVNVAPLGRFAANRANENKLTFVMADNYARVYKVQLLRFPFQHGNLVDVNYTLLSLETKILKEEIRAVVAEMFSVIGDRIKANKAPLMIDFGVLGTLYADHRRIQFAFGEKNGKGREISGNAAFQKYAPETSRSLSLQGVGTSRESKEEEERKIDVPQEEDIQPFKVPPLQLGGSRGTESKSADHAEAVWDGEFDDDLDSASALEAKQQETNHGDPPIVYPVFLNTEAIKTRKEDPMARTLKRTEQLETNMVTAFERLETEMLEELEKLQREDEEIARRNEQSEMAYKQKLLDAKKNQLEMNAFLVEQAKQRREQEQKEMFARKHDSAIISTGTSRAFPVERDPDFETIAQSKKQLQTALEEQIKEKRRRQREERANTVAEERYLIDCNIKLMREDRKSKIKQREESRMLLKGHWGRQRKLQEMQKKILEAKNGKALDKSASEGLLTIRARSYLKK